MKTHTAKWFAALLLLTLTGTATADNNFGVGVKAGTLGLGVEGTWRALPYLDVRLGANTFDYSDSGSQAGVNYDGELNLEQFYLTANLRFPLSPFRLTAGAYSNGNEINLASADNGSVIVIGDTPYPADLVGRVTSKTSFSSTAPYLGVGYDFTLGGKFGLNLDFGVLWQGDPEVSVAADGILGTDPTFQAALEAERRELVDEVSDYKAWPVISLGFNYNF